MTACAPASSPAATARHPAAVDPVPRRRSRRRAQHCYGGLPLAGGNHAHLPGRLVLLRDPADRAVGAMAIYVENERLAVLTSALRRAHQPGGDLFVPHRS